MRSKLLLAATAIAFMAAAPAAADVKAGVDAWQHGNYEAAIKEWRPLAEKGDADAQFNMGQAYKLGRGVPTDLRLAQTWYEKAAQQGHPQAQGNLGLILFQNGQREQAMPWIKKAADFGDPRAQYILATALFNGDLVAKDFPRAYALMKRAADQGIPPAKTSLEQMEGFLSAEDRQKGLQLAAELQRSDTANAAGASTPIPNARTQPPAPPTQIAAAAPVSSPPRPPLKVPVATPSAAAHRPAAPASRAGSVVPTPAPSPAHSLAIAGGRWRVQLGAFGSPAIARGEWTSLSRKIGALSGLQPFYEPAGALTRLRVGPLADRAAADRVCAAAKAAGQACFPIAP